MAKTNSQKKSPAKGAETIPNKVTIDKKDYKAGARESVKPIDAISQAIDDDLELKIPKINPTIGYLNKEDGLYCFKLANGERARKDDGEMLTESPLEVLCNFANEEQTGEFGKVIAFTNSHGIRQEVPILDKDLQTKPTEIKRLLADCGLVFMPKSQFATDPLIKYLIFKNSDQKRMLVSKTGWIDQQTFALPTEIVGTGKEKYFFSGKDGEEFRSYIYEKGTLKGWQEFISKPFGLASKRAILAICAELASPLIGLMGGEPALIVHFFGNSSKGKTTVLQIAQSALGRNEKQDINIWNSTHTGLELLATSHNDMPLALDEMSAFKDKTKLLGLVYFLAEGGGRHRSNTDITAKKTNRWRLIIISTGEEAIRDIAEDCNSRILAGREVRCIDIPIETGVPNESGIFENCPINPITGKPIDLNSETGGHQLKAYLAEQGSKNFGLAVPAFIKCLVSIINEPICDGEPEYLRRIVNELIQEFVEKVTPAQCSSQIKRVAEHFGLIYSAGMLASGYNNLIDRDRLKSVGYDEEIDNITGWTQLQVFGAVKTCFNAWLEHFGSGQDREIDDVIQKINAEIEGNLKSYESINGSPNGNNYKEFLGWLEARNDGLHVFILPSRFKKLTNRQEIKRKLLELGILVNEKKYKGSTYTEKVDLPIGNGEHRYLSVYHLFYAARANEQEAGETDSTPTLLKEIKEEEITA